MAASLKVSGGILVCFDISYYYVVAQATLSTGDVAWSILVYQSVTGASGRYHKKDFQPIREDAPTFAINRPTSPRRCKWCPHRIRQETQEWRAGQKWTSSWIRISSSAWSSGLPCPEGRLCERTECTNTSQPRHQRTESTGR